MNYQPRNPSIRQHNCEYSPTCSQPARPEPYQLEHFNRWLCDEHAHFALAEAIKKAAGAERVTLELELNRLRRRKAVEGWEGATEDEDFRYCVTFNPQSVRSIHRFGSDILGGK